MGHLRLILLLVGVLALAKGKPKPTTESTHSILKRLGFDLVQKSPGINHHSKRVALETNKARYHNDFYSSNSDSRMFVVKLPPHSPYYSHAKPEKFKSEAPEPKGETGARQPETGGATPKTSSFQTNGKPGQIYHWNIPILRKISQEKRGTSVRSVNEDSKIYHIKILPKQVPVKNSSGGQEIRKKNKHKANKQQQQQAGDGIKTHKYYRNKLYRFSDSSNGTSDAIFPLIGGSFISSSISSGGGGSKNNHRNNTVDSLGSATRNNSTYEKYNSNKKFNDKYLNEVSKIKSKTNRGPNYYVPAIPQQNSFYKYFTGNGKLKSFYVIEKSKKQTRLHRLL